MSIRLSYYSIFIIIMLKHAIAHLQTVCVDASLSRYDYQAVPDIGCLRTTIIPDGSTTYATFSSPSSSTKTVKLHIDRVQSVQPSFQHDYAIVTQQNKDNTDCGNNTISVQQWSLIHLSTCPPSAHLWSPRRGSSCLCRRPAPAVVRRRPQRGVRSAAPPATRRATRPGGLAPPAARPDPAATRARRLEGPAAADGPPPRTASSRTSRHHPCNQR